MTSANDEDKLDVPLDFVTRDFQHIDEHLRCPICKELLHAAMMLTACSHSFCALCIRRSLSIEQHCPKCRKPAHESNLIQNYDLDNVVYSWHQSRKLLLNMDLQFNSNSESSIAHINNKTEDIPVQLTSKSTVNCPVCLISMEYSALDKHIDKCLKGSSSSDVSTPKKEKQQVNMGKKPNRVVYAVMSDKDLRDCLKSLNIPDHGERSQKIWRHKEYLNLYNANCDSRHPVTAKVLLQRLREMEKVQFSTFFKRKAADPDTHKRKYADHYQCLVDSVKRAKKDRNARKLTICMYLNERFILTAYVI